MSHAIVTVTHCIAFFVREKKRMNRIAFFMPTNGFKLKNDEEEDEEEEEEDEREKSLSGQLASVWTLMTLRKVDKITHTLEYYGQ